MKPDDNFTTIDSAPEHLALLEGLRQQCCDSGIPVDQVLAIVCQLAGAVIAVQDTNRYSHEEVMLLVTKNMKAGNELAAGQLNDTSDPNSGTVH